MDVGTVPFVPAGMEAPPKIGGQGQETLIRPSVGHTRMLGLKGKPEAHTVGIAVGPAHDIIALAEEREGFVHDADTPFHVGAPCGDHVQLRIKWKQDRLCFRDVHLYLLALGCTARPGGGLSAGEWFRGGGSVYFLAVSSVMLGAVV